jgi:penicillin-binding protein 1A
MKISSLSSFFTVTLAILGVSGSFFLGLLFFLFRHPCVDFSVLARYNQGRPSILYDDQGKEWERFQLDKRDPISIKGMPAHLIHAFIAAEDWSFFSHNGLSWRGIVRSLLVNIRHGRIVQGASTITQQLVKMLFYDNRRTFKRKFKEQFLTLLVERQFTKEHILETYLNHIYFGCGMYGVSAAAQRFWGKKIGDLEPQESALLAAIVCSPGHYSPLSFPYSALQRRNSVLSKMEKLHFITHADSLTLRATSLGIVPASVRSCAPYVKEYIRTVLEEKYGKEQLYHGGLAIRTTLNKEIQLAAEEVFKKHFVGLRAKYGADMNGALMSIDRVTGEIKALIGGVSFTESQFNRALHARRQQGSVFKPLVYAVALEKGMSLLDTAIDEPFCWKQGSVVWEPRNHNRAHVGEMTLARALSFSNNVISAKVILTIGPEAVVELAKKCHLTGSIPAYPSLALGCLDSSLSEVAGMFNVFANAGVYCEPHLIVSVKDSWGKIIYKAQPLKERVVSLRVASQIGQNLALGIDRKRKVGTPWIDSMALTKTGTTNDARICWFAGSTPEITTVVYVGCDDNRPMGKNVYPVHTAYPIWFDLHTRISTVSKHFSFDPALQSVLVNWRTGVIVSPSDDNKDVVSLLV